MSWEEMTFEQRREHDAARMDANARRVLCGPYTVTRVEPGSSAVTGNKMIHPPEVPPIISTHDGEDALPLPGIDGHREQATVANAGDELPLPSYAGKPLTETVLSGYGSVRRPAVKHETVQNVPAADEDEVLGLPTFGLCPDGE